MLILIFALTLAALAYAVVTTEDLKEVLMSFKDDVNARLDAESAKIDAAEARVVAALGNTLSDADAAAILAKVDTNSAKVDALAAAPAPQPQP